MLPLSICILKGSGSNLRVTENLGQNGFVAVCAMLQTVPFTLHSVACNFESFHKRDLNISA